MASEDILNFIREKKLETVILQMEANIKKHFDELKAVEARNKTFIILIALIYNDELAFDMYRFYYIEEFKATLKEIYDMKQKESVGAAKYFIRRLRQGKINDVELHAASKLKEKIVSFEKSIESFIGKNRLPINYFLAKERKTIGLLTDQINASMSFWGVNRNTQDIYSIFRIFYITLYYRYLVIKKESISAAEMYLECLRKKDPACEAEIKNLIFVSASVQQRLLLYNN